MTAYPLDFRQKIVSAYEAGNTSIRKVAERFMVTKRTVHRLIKQNRETGDLTPKKVGTNKPSPLEEYKEIIIETVEQHPDWTLWQYCEEIAEKTGVSVSTASMCGFLAKQGMTLKKKTFRSEKVATQEVQQERVDYWQEVKDVAPENLIFIDESALWEGMERPVARSPKGRKAFCLRAAYKGQKHTLIGAISIKGLVCIKTIKGSMKGKDFEAFIQDDLCPHLSSEHVVVMDNLNSHKSIQVQQLITATGAKPLYLPRYSPDFNPIEMLWSVLKAFVRKFKPPSLLAINIVLKTFFLLIDKSFFTNWFSKCCYCIP
jgi:transposase